VEKRRQTGWQCFDPGDSALRIALFQDDKSHDSVRSASRLGGSADTAQTIERYDRCDNIYRSQCIGKKTTGFHVELCNMTKVG
jgi:hypothetical protein